MNVCMLRWSAGGIAVALTLSALGCGGIGGRVNKVTVTGTVTYDGKPVEAGMIQFVLNEAGIRGGDNATGSIINGKFSVSTVTPGKNSVVVSGGGSRPAAVPTPTKMTYENRPKMPDEVRQMQRPEDGMAIWAKFHKADDDSIPWDAPGNGQEFDIGGKDGTHLDIKILKK